MNKIIIVGAGNIGSAIAAMLADAGGYKIVVCDRDSTRFKTVQPHPAITTCVVDITDQAALQPVLQGSFAVLSAAPFHLTTKIAEAAATAGVHYLDLTEDVASTKRVMELAVDAKSAFVPQCGLAPGYISILANDLAGKFDTLEAVKLRVGALPQYPSNALNYNLTWSTDGMINEYIEPCEAIVDGHLATVPAMEQREEFSLDGVTYEAFNTSGGLGTLCATYSGRVRTLNYKTIRYPGHASIMKVLLNDLNLRNRRDTLKDILEQALPSTNQDVVVVFVTASGYINGRLMQETHAQKIYSGIIAGRRYSAIQLTTAAGICTVLDMLATGMLPSTGFIRQEDVALGQFLENRFGRYYKPRLQMADEPDAARLSQSEPENGPNDNFPRPVSMKNRG
ncbi:saccharopine dehydrogenase family protein [Aeromonas hydrophila]|uniref:saccharopine dehydrogenase family protein n=1 Tax=Aeromonas hydrophila TaxID=644 RepID=UPI0009FB5708|nr:saccharopine dehydrogenase family protein [Aeromonas hydrophila]AWA06583.1 saccharopine dehydrogenase family protein [Aeromonas hydrophila subsp. hydrophila]